MSNADQHGPTCAETPADHRCGDSESDQMVSWSELARLQSEKLSIINSIHVQGQGLNGAVTGYCAECDWQWPCPTAHVVKGWGLRENCEEEGYCSHAGVKITRLAE